MPEIIRILADDMMPGVEACFSQWRDAHGQAPQFAIERVSGRAMRALPGVQLLLVRSITRVDAALLAGADALRFVGSATIGHDHLDHQALASAEVAWATAPGCNAQAVAEWVLATILRQASDMSLATLRQRRVGIVGMGHVGRRVAVLLRALGLSVIGCDPLLSAPEKAALGLDGWAELPELLAQCDIICLHTPLTHDGPAPTHHLLNVAMLACLKSSAWLINAGRGDVICPDALIAYLRRDDAATALLDVLPNEPTPSAELIALCRQVSPHIAGHSVEGKWRGTWQISAQAAAHFGYRQVGEVTALMPADQPPVYVWPSTADAAQVAPYAALMASVVDCAGDDQRLRQVGTAGGFDDLRKYYATRREIAAQRVSGASSTASELLTALGFSC